MDYTAPEKARDASLLHADKSYESHEFEDLIYLISHDVRNSVRALIELPQWIAEDLAQAGVKLEGSVAESIELMNTHTGRLDRMLVDLLTFSRVGRMQDLTEIEVDVALSEVLEEMRIPQGFTVTADLCDNTLFLGERDAFTLLTHLVSNAIKHHDKGSGEITITVKRNVDGTVLQVADDGPGILPQYREKVFSAMTTLRPRDEVEGSGMGLTIVRKIALCYGGGVTLSEGADGRGTTVEIQLPEKGAVTAAMLSHRRTTRSKGH